MDSANCRPFLSTIKGLNMYTNRLYDMFHRFIFFPGLFIFPATGSTQHGSQANSHQISEWTFPGWGAFGKHCFGDNRPAVSLRKRTVYIKTCSSYILLLIPLLKLTIIKYSWHKLKYIPYINACLLSIFFGFFEILSEQRCYCIYLDRR